MDVKTWTSCPTGSGSDATFTGDSDGNGSNDRSVHLAQDGDSEVDADFKIEGTVYDFDIEEP